MTTTEQRLADALRAVIDTAPGGVRANKADNIAAKRDSILALAAYDAQQVATRGHWNIRMRHVGGAFIYEDDETLVATCDDEKTAAHIAQCMNAQQVQPSWSEDDARLAASEGWCVSDTSDGFAEIQRIDEAEVFGEDAQAIAHVYWMAGTGSEPHRRAIAYTLRDGNTWTYTQASIAARAKRSAHVRMCVNAHDGLVAALQESTEADMARTVDGAADMSALDWVTRARDNLRMEDAREENTMVADAVDDLNRAIARMGRALAAAGVRHA